MDCRHGISNKRPQILRRKMLVLYFALGIIGFIALAERLLRQKQSIHTYFFWFLVILGSMYTAKGYCSTSIGDFFIDEEVFHVDDIEEPEEWPDQDWIGEYQVKFVPPGTPSHYINENGTLSKACLNRIQSTDKNTAHQSLKLHMEKGEECFREAQKICWYLPKLSEREKAKMVFTTVLAAFPGPLHLKAIAATIALLGQYGICCIDEYYDVDFNMEMAKYHFMLADAFAAHIKNNG